ncbi:Phosphoglycerate dehydrogenase and related dehydrogenase [Hahella chejuensis KCTC 2396]|uniref:Phosphoglycerate dehydrogenase and related dehydrogenase n=1 Tax=Hahella chejuensis (strain KCTC 2396) TaxID=349521 RepID=Q2SP02_HAHCH|nr:D-2-hydroxyacid dehydrogenase family protein [Hahella chejuensis]ABC27622.1 Phosphoglycerate dehydrogenase and related dehydrogenase [Hahella chejuensis KCTC 2396]
MDEIVNRRLRCAVLDDYQNVAKTYADWSALETRIDLQVFNRHLGNEDEVAAQLAEFDIIVIMRERTPFGASLLNRLPRLKLLVTSGPRNAAIDLAAAKANGVTVCGTQASKAPPTELTWALILGLARHTAIEDAAFKANGPWQNTVGVDLAGKTLGLLGFGHIGQKVATIGQAFGMNIIAWSANLTEDLTRSMGVTLAESKDALLECSDIVSIHLVLGERSWGLIDAEALSRMKKSALLINTSRAQIVDQTALVEALQQKRIAGAGLDVFEQEPLPEGHVLRTLPNVLAIPHQGYVTENNYRTYYTQIVEAIQAYLDGAPVREMS